MNKVMVLGKLSPVLVAAFSSFDRLVRAPLQVYHQKAAQKKLDMSASAQAALRAAHNKRMRKQGQRIIECRHLI